MNYKKNFICILSISVLTFIVYFPCLQNKFVNWDDNVNIYENNFVNNISSIETLLNGTQEIFINPDQLGNYNPLPILTFGFEKLFYGLKSPEYFHLTNIVLHAICVFLIFKVCLSLGLNLIPATFCALLFAVQPMRVESVAWVTERKDVLYGLFYLISLNFYILSVKNPLKKKYKLYILLSFILALLSKIQAVTLPLSMLLIDYYFGRKINFKLIHEKLIYFLLSIVTGITGIYFLWESSSIQNNETFPLISRIFIGSYSYIIYIIKSAFPYKTVPVYPYPATIDWNFYASAIPTLLIALLLFLAAIKNKKEIVFGLSFFTINIMFLLQVLGAGQGFLADRFTYIAYFGLFFIYSYLLQKILEKKEQYKKPALVIAFIIILIFSYMNFQQNKVWKNGETLWSYVLKYYPYAPEAWYHRGDYYKLNGQNNRAIKDFSKSIQYSNDKKIKIESLINRGMTFLELKMPEKALNDLSDAEKIDPSNLDILNFKSFIYFNYGKFGFAKLYIEKYLKLNDKNPDMWSNLSIIYRVKKQYMNSIKAIDRSIEIKNDDLGYYYNRLITYYEMGNYKSAIDDLLFLKSRGFKKIGKKYMALLHH